MVFKNHETVTFVVIMSWFVMTIEMSTVYKHFNIYKTEYLPDDSVQSIPYKVHYNDTEQLNMVVKIRNELQKLNGNVSLHFKIITDDDEDTFSKDILLVETYSIKGKLKTKKTKIDIFLKIGKKKYCTWRLFDGTRTKGKKCHMECGLRTCTYNKPCLVEITLSDDCLDSDKSGGRHKYHSISRKDALAYGIGGFVVVCAALLVYVCVRRYRNKPDAQQTMELNTYATTNPVLYADLEMARGGNRTPVRAEESPYAEIIGVLKPKENVETN
ncbi:uncharacterized protein LOC124643749 isoform X2 [Helicoverpa zea]|uniref:uncharacterized protein LOC124643749 isoform X2 n=1 Tax=Helicoverpa zea TaxID=7113 RepID=UPI001F58B0CC|nr:uncharacterized protein LOC124643749 isoform X2 [Helicoverpa zea]